ncbi:MAG TPA: hypothetical protein VG733_07875, partial [Chthoniobacteraceae bacterium]|nr:hypothetical protein [Chthoniobacteraceae bacterium]
IGLISAAILPAAFSSFSSKLAGKVVCVMVFLISVAAVLTVGILVFFLYELRYMNFGPPQAAPEKDPRILFNTSVLFFPTLVYFVLSAVCCTPLVSPASLRRCGIWLHLILLPIALLLLVITRDYWFEYGYVLDFLSISLPFGLVYALLWFRMADLRQTALKKIANR